MPRSPAASLLLGAVLISFAPVFVRMCNQPPAAIALVRTALGAAVLLGLFGRESLRAWKEGSFRRGLPLLGLAGLSFACDLVLWHTSIQKIGAGMATVLANTQIFHVLILSHFVFGERLPPAFWGWCTVAFVGVGALSVGTLHASYLASVPPGEVTWGLGCGLATGFCYSLFLLSLKTVQRRHGLSAAVTHTGGSIACAGSVLVIDLCGTRDVAGLASATPIDWGSMVALALVVHVVGWLVITRAIRSVPSGVSSLLLLTQPALATLWGALLFGERFAPLQLVGTVALFIAVVAAQRSNRPDEAIG